jgi:hypothetical protein
MVMIWLILALTLTQTYGYDLVDSRSNLNTDLWL